MPVLQNHPYVRSALNLRVTAIYEHVIESDKILEARLFKTDVLILIRCPLTLLLQMFANVYVCDVAGFSKLNRPIQQT